MAIAYDNSTVDSSSANRSDTTFSHTTSGSNRALVVMAYWDNFAGGREVSNVTYNGVALTKALTLISGPDDISLDIWYLANPASGSNDVFLDDSGSAVAWDAVIAMSYTDVDQDDPVGAIQSATGTSSSPSLSITTENDNSMIVAGNHGYGGDTDPFAPANGETEREDGATGTSTSLDGSYWAGELGKASAGAQTIGGTMNASDDWVIGAIELRVAGAVSEKTKTFTADGIIKEQTTETFTADGIIKAEKTKTFTVDGIIKAIQTNSFTVDGIVAAVQTKEFTVDGLIAISRYEINNVIVPRPVLFQREYLHAKKDVISIEGKGGRDLSGLKEKFLIGWEYLTEAELNKLLAIVEENAAVTFVVNDGNLVINETSVMVFIKSVDYEVLGNSYLASTTLELVEVT